MILDSSPKLWVDLNNKKHTSRSTLLSKGNAEREDFWSRKLLGVDEQDFLFVEDFDTRGLYVVHSTNHFFIDQFRRMEIKRIVLHCFGGAKSKRVALTSAQRVPLDDFEEWRVDHENFNDCDIHQGNIEQGRYHRKPLPRQNINGEVTQEQEEVLKAYLGRSASATSIPRALSNSSLRRCCHTPERKNRDAVMMFDDEGKVVVKEAGKSPRISSISRPESSITESDNGYTHHFLHTPDGSDGCNIADDESEGLSTCGDSCCAPDFHGMIDLIEPALSSVFNPNSTKTMKESCFKELAMRFDGHIVGRSLVKEPRSMRRNLSWGHFSEISFNITQSSSELCVPGRRHTVLVLTSEDDLDNDKDGEDGPSPCDEHKGPVIHRRLSSIYESHHVHLSKLQEQMGDSESPPEDLLELMARKIYSSHACISQMNLGEGISESLSGISMNHDLSTCSERLPKIKTKCN